MTSISRAMLGSGPIFVLLVAGGCGGEAPALPLADAFFDPTAASAPAAERAADVDGLAADLSQALAADAPATSDTPLFGVETAALSAAAIGGGSVEEP